MKVEVVRMGMSRLILVKPDFELETKKELDALKIKSNVEYRKKRNEIADKLKNRFSEELDKLRSGSFAEEIVKQIKSISTLSVVACKANLFDGTVADPCLIFLDPKDHSRALDFKQFASKASLISVERSEFALPEKIQLASHSTPEVGSDGYADLQVSIGVADDYVVRAFSFFFAAGNLRGKDINPNFYKSPPDKYLDYRLYKMGSTLNDEITVVV